MFQLLFSYNKMLSWITVLNLFLVLVIFVTSMTIPDDDYDYAKLTGDVDDDERNEKSKDNMNNKRLQRKKISSLLSTSLAEKT